MPLMRFPALLLLLIASAVGAQAPAPPGRPAGADPAITTAEIEALRPAVYADLERQIAIVDNIDHPTLADERDEFQQCRFTPVPLGRVGTAVLVQSDIGSGAANAGMLNLYLREKESYRRILQGEGFGPRVISRPGQAPDLVFGWTEGVCHASYERYRWNGRTYDGIACDQEEVPANGDTDHCAIAACPGPHPQPTFPDPWPPGAWLRKSEGHEPLSQPVPLAFLLR